MWLSSLKILPEDTGRDRKITTMSRPSNTKMPKKQRTGLAGARYRKYAKAVQESKDDLIMGVRKHM